MGKQRGYRSPVRRPIRRRVVLIALALFGLGAAGAWGLLGRDAGGGTPRLVVDRAEADLGYRRFDTPARAVFTLANAGDGLLRLRGTPEVLLKAGC